jgi:hypothetical protein
MQTFKPAGFYPEQPAKQTAHQSPILNDGCLCTQTIVNPENFHY